MSNDEIFMVVYSIIGCIVVFFNVPICFLIYFSKTLRPCKELILIGGLCLADTVQALANILSGIQRLVLYSQNQAFVPESSLRCYVEPFNVLFFFGYHLVGIMTMLVSADRLVAVLKPVQHEVICSRRNGIALTIGDSLASHGLKVKV
ncbi:hypothetical protein L596_015748 [Steinernema carpocapsae]|uniref:G-protein coupled receptors family 1 profile domain-containing protein n=1 Tax=Steinernema carpocapsae TaxID=34508 RepID=A0A4U5NG26_STECR|nr:hypothetical protein L596_015748 [Steinernema carpocapsae]